MPPGGSAKCKISPNKILKSLSLSCNKVICNNVTNNLTLRQLLKRLDHIYNTKIALSFFNTVLSQFLREAWNYISVKKDDLVI